ncbi:FecR family protein [Cellulophaga omnivescoria]|uniref:FecR family protein n=1 Tax=Cellulophaga omnivescoria TaxID=1888890 RepID=UPI000984C69C|nr:FecR domain-containing protein [Cellulophaga omnivescoria]
MENKDIEELIIKYLNGEVSPSELDALSTWVAVEGNAKVFENFVKLHYKILLIVSKPDTGQILHNLKVEIKKSKRLKASMVYKYALAASLILFLTLGFLISYTSDSSNQNRNQINSVIRPGKDKAILTLEDGREIELDEKESFKNKNAVSSKGQLVYTTNVNNYSEAELLKYNYITVPRGGKFVLKLTDGTKVWLNSESQLKYPVSFKEGENRQVELVYGEAYFDVSPSTQHNGSKFRVKNEQQLVEVLGTEFNIKAYKNETEILTTLVEGSIAMNNGSHTAILLPGEQSKLILGVNGFEVYRVDAADEVSWVEGKFSFTNRTLSEIVKVLSRWYNIEILITDEDIKNIKFTGVLSRNESIIEILETIQITNNINYKVNENNTKITIKKKG